MMNVFHLMQKPGSSTISALGGLHQMSGWDGPIMTDSGGFQAYSLIRQNPRAGSLSDQGIRFQPEGTDRPIQLTPEKSIQLQMAYGADILVCLDDCTHVDAATAEQQISVARTIKWARRCKDEFERLLRQHRSGSPYAELPARPLLFAVVQGGGSEQLRRECAEALLEIGFDGYGYGGWPLDAQGKLLHEMLRYTRSLIPPAFPMHALGVGHPDSVVVCHKLGYQMFDSALPTRDARSGRLYTFTSDSAGAHFQPRGNWWEYIYVEDKKHIKANRPTSAFCDCYTCQHYSLGYMHHLHKVSDSLYYRLATIHNLRFMMRLVETLAHDTYAGR
nr:Glutathione S-transferase, N-terminal domain protein [uncultured bacterium]